MEGSKDLTESYQALILLLHDGQPWVHSAISTSDTHHYKLVLRLRSWLGATPLSLMHHTVQSALTSCQSIGTFYLQPADASEIMCSNTGERFKASLVS